MKALALVLLLAAGPAAAQDTLRLPALQSAAVERDPRLSQVELREAETALRLRNLDVARLPRLTLGGEAAHQSEVGSIPLSIPNLEIPRPPRDRVEAAVNGTLLLYDGGATGARRAAERARLEAERAEIAATLYPLRIEVAQSYFAALLLQERIREAGTVIDDLEARLRVVRAQLRHGAALPGDTAALRAEVLAAAQRRDELAAERRTALEVLRSLTGRAISGADVLALPDFGGEPPDTSAEIRAHPQYAVFAARREGLERQAEVLRSQTRPQASAFGTLAYGRPGLTLFEDRLHEYWLAGVRVQWNPWDWGESRRERQALDLQRRILDTEEAAFTERLRRQVRSPLETIERLRGALDTDDRIVALREQVVRQARAQFEERVTTPAAYVDALTDLEAARVTRLRHRVELAQARVEYLGVLGVEVR